MPPPPQKPRNTARTSTRQASPGQRFGQVTSSNPPLPGTGQLASYCVRDEQTGLSYTFGDADIVTEGFRTVRVGERVRFLADPAHPGQANYVIRLDQPDITEYYK